MSLQKRRCTRTDKGFELISKSKATIEGENTENCHNLSQKQVAKILCQFKAFIELGPSTLPYH